RQGEDAEGGASEDYAGSRERCHTSPFNAPFLVTRAVALVPECRTIGDIKAILGTRRSPPLPPRVSGWLLRPTSPPGTARTTGLSRAFPEASGAGGPGCRTAPGPSEQTSACA